MKLTYAELPPALTDRCRIDGVLDVGTILGVMAAKGNPTASYAPKGVDANEWACAASAALLAQREEEANARSIGFKIGPSGTMVLTGIGRMGVSLYPKQWDVLLADETIAAAKAFLAKERPNMSTGKDDRRFDQSKAEAKAKFEAKAKSGS